MIPEETCGLSPVVQAKLMSVFKQFPKIRRVIMYGSRALGNFKPGSDIDLTLDGDELTTQDLLTILNQIDDLLLPYKVDLSILQLIDHDSLLDHVKRVGVEWR